MWRYYSLTKKSNPDHYPNDIFLGNHLPVEGHGVVASGVDDDPLPSLYLSYPSCLAAALTEVTLL